MLEGRVYEKAEWWPVFTPAEASMHFVIHFNKTSRQIVCTSKTPIFMYKKNQNFDLLLSYAILFRSEAILTTGRRCSNC